MDAEGLLPVDRVAPMDPASLRLLDRAAERAKDLFAACLHLAPEAQRDLFQAREFLFRRWVLELVLIVRFRGPIGYGEVSRTLGGIPSGSLSPKLKELQAAGVLARTETGDELGRVLYSVSEEASPLADAVYTLTMAKVYQTVTVVAGERAPAIGGFERFDASSGDATRFLAARDAYAAAARAFAAHHQARQSATRFESALESATRFAASCDRKWQGAVMIALLQGPASFAGLRARVGLGDQALALALRELQATRAVERSPEGVYRLAPFAIFDLSFGVGALTLSHALTRSTRPAYPG